MAYYLGAKPIPGNTSQIVTDGFEHPLRTARSFENEVESVLKQTFLLDCVTRMEGFYRIDLHECQQIEPLIDLDFAVLKRRDKQRRGSRRTDDDSAPEPQLPLWAALDIARDRNIIGGQYLVVGDGNINVVQTESIVAVLYDIETKGDAFELTPITYISGDEGLGGLVILRLSKEDRLHLTSGSLPTLMLAKDELDNIFCWRTSLFVSTDGSRGVI